MMALESLSARFLILILPSGFIFIPRLLSNLSLFLGACKSQIAKRVLASISSIFL
jgi:hypothetical protein